MSVPVNRMGSSASIMNAVSNSTVNRDETGDGIIELDDMGDLMKLESGDLIGVDVAEDVSCEPAEEEAISSASISDPPPKPQIHTLNACVSSFLKSARFHKIST